MKPCSKILYFLRYFWLPETPKLSLSPLLRLIMFIPQVTNIHSKFQLDTMSGSAKIRSKYFSQCYSYGEFWQLYPPFWTPLNLKSELLRLFMVGFTIVGHPNFQTATLYDVGKWVRIYVSESVSQSVSQSFLELYII